MSEPGYNERQVRALYADDPEVSELWLSRMIAEARERDEAEAAAELRWGGGDDDEPDAA